MTPDEVAELQRSQTRQLALDAQAPLEALEQAANEVAKIVRSDAARSGRSVGIRVVRKPTGVRVTVTGPNAPRYRRVVEDELDKRIPGVEAQVRARITRSP